MHDRRPNHADPTRGTLATLLAPLTRDPARAAVMCDVDGTLAPIVDRPDEARVPEDVSRLLGALSRRYACVACVSGRPALDARRLVGERGIAYAGLHGAEMLAPGQERPRLTASFESSAGCGTGASSPPVQSNLRRSGSGSKTKARSRRSIGAGCPTRTRRWRSSGASQMTRRRPV